MIGMGPKKRTPEQEYKHSENIEMLTKAYGSQTFKGKTVQLSSTESKYMNKSELKKLAKKLGVKEFQVKGA